MTGVKQSLDRSGLFMISLTLWIFDLCGSLPEMSEMIKHSHTLYLGCSRNETCDDSQCQGLMFDVCRLICDHNLVYKSLPNESDLINFVHSVSSHTV